MKDYDIVNGQRVPQTLITNNETLHGTHTGSIQVVGCEFVIMGTLNGSLSVTDGGMVQIRGIHNGSLSVANSCHVRIVGISNGSTSISTGGSLLIEQTGRLSGSMSNDGRFQISGAFGGAYQGNGIRTLEGNGYIKQPIIRAGVHYYEW